MGWGGVVYTVIFMSNPTVVLCCVGVGVGVLTILRNSSNLYPRAPVVRLVIFFYFPSVPWLLNVKTTV